MRQQAVQKDQRSLLGFKRNQACRRKWSPVERLKLRCALPITREAFLQTELVTARQRPHTTVLLCGVFQGEPKAGHAERFSVKKSRVLMTDDFTANLGLLEDIHGLQQ